MHAACKDRALQALIGQVASCQFFPIPPGNGGRRLEPPPWAGLLQRFFLPASHNLDFVLFLIPAIQPRSIYFVNRIRDCSVNRAYYVAFFQGAREGQTPFRTPSPPARPLC